MPVAMHSPLVKAVVYARALPEGLLRGSLVFVSAITTLLPFFLPLVNHYRKAFQLISIEVACHMSHIVRK